MAACFSALQEHRSAESGTGSALSSLGTCLCSACKRQLPTAPEEAAAGCSLALHGDSPTVVHREKLQHIADRSNAQQHIQMQAQ